MALPRSLSRALVRLAALVIGVVAVGLVAVPAARADTFTVSLVLAPGQSGPIGRLVSNTDVTPVSTCDSELKVSFDATNAGTVRVTQIALVGSYTCSVDFQLSGQSTGLVELVSVTVVPGLSINDVALPERSVGPQPLAVTPDGFLGTSPTLFTFTVALSQPATGPVTVAVATADGTATDEGTATTSPDYTPLATTVTFPAGVTSQSVTVEVQPDNVQEADETFFVNLSAPTGARIIDGQGVGTIVNDDNPGPIHVLVPAP